MTRSYLDPFAVARSFAAALLLAQSSTPAAQRSTIAPVPPGAAATAAQPLSVRVLIIDDETGAWRSASGASVTLVDARDPAVTWCAAGAIRKCDSRGRASFADAPSRFSITAEVDLPQVPPVVGAPRTTGSLPNVRLATTLLDLQPTASEVWVPIFLEQDEPDLVLDAYLTGTVTNLPPLGAGEVFTVEVSTREGGPDYNWWAFVNVDAMNPTVGSYGIEVPSNNTLDLALVRHGPFPGPKAAMLDLGVPVGAVVSYRDLAWGARPLLPFSTTGVSFPNQLTGNQLKFVFMSMRGGVGEDVEIILHYGPPGPLPGALQVPPSTHAGYLGLVPHVTAEQFDAVTFGPGSASCTEDLASTDFAFDMLGLPSLSVAPSLPVPQAWSQTLDYAAGIGALAWGNGFDVLEFVSEDTGIEGVAESCWSLFARPAWTSPAEIVLPPLARPMFGAEARCDIEFNTVRFDAPFDFDSFFDASLVANLRGLDASIQAESEADVAASFVTTTCSVDLFQLGYEIPVRMLQMTEDIPAGSPSGADLGVAADRLSSQYGTPQQTLECIVAGLNEIYGAQTGVTFHAEQVLPVADIGPGALVSSGVWGAGQLDGKLSTDEVRSLRNFLVDLEVVPAGMIVLAPVELIEDNSGNSLGIVVQPVSAPMCGAVDCDATIPAGMVDNLAFVSDLGDKQTFAHEVGHCFGLCHCTATDGLPQGRNLMNTDRPPELPTPRDATGTFCAPSGSNELCFSTAQIVQVQTVACGYTTLLAPFP